MLGQHHRKKHEKPVATAARKAGTKQTTAPPHASIASPVNTKIKPEKSNASIVQQALFQKTFVPRNVTCPPKDLWRVLQKQAKWPSLSVGVPIVPEPAVTKDAAAPPYVPLARSKPIEPALIVPRVTFPPVAPPVVKNATKVNLHRPMLPPLVKCAMYHGGLLPKTKEAVFATVVRWVKFPRVSLV